MAEESTLSSNDKDMIAALRAEMSELKELLQSRSQTVLPDEALLILPADDVTDKWGYAIKRKTRTALPDPKLIRKIIRQRQNRGRFFNPDLFADPAWDMLLDLSAAMAEHIRVSITSLCIASGVPATTALRWIGVLESEGLILRVSDAADRRRAFVALSDKGHDAIARYFAEISPIGSRVI